MTDTDSKITEVTVDGVRYRMVDEQLLRQALEALEDLEPEVVPPSRFDKARATITKLEERLE